MSFLFGPDYRPQLDRIEAKVDAGRTILNNLLALVKNNHTATTRRLDQMSAQEQELNVALNEHFAALSAGLDRLEAKINEIPEAVDLKDEIESLRASTTAFQARVDADTTDPPPAE